MDTQTSVQGTTILLEARKGTRQTAQERCKALRERQYSIVYVAELTDDAYEETFFSKGQGKLQGKRSSGKGKGNNKNPQGRDGAIMKCFCNGSIMA